MAKRKGARSREQVDGIVKRIATDMAKGRWIRGVSGELLAGELGVTVSMVRQWATQASRLVWSESDGDLAELKASTISRLDTIAAKAEAAGRFSAAVAALDAQADIAGIKPRNATFAVQINLGGEPMKVGVTDAAAVLQRASSFFSERHPELVEEFRAYLTEGSAT